jgi:penicillin amidase
VKRGYLASFNGSRARGERLRAVLSSGSLALDDFAALQHDVRAWNAERLVPLFSRVQAARPPVEAARRQLLDWDREVSVDSVAAATYVTWERSVKRMLVESRLPSALVDEFIARTPNMLVPALTAPTRLWFDGNVLQARDRLILTALEAAVDELAGRSGGDGAEPWGRMQQVVLAHPLAITDAARRLFNVGPFARPGYAETVMSISARRAETAVGASFAAIFDAADWDRSVAQNPPGQSESRASAHFADLARLWNEQKYFPLLFSDEAVAANTAQTLTLLPRQTPQSPQ